MDRYEASPARGGGRRAGLLVRGKHPGAAAGAIERVSAAAAIKIRHTGVPRGQVCPLGGFLVTFCPHKKPPGTWVRGGPTNPGGQRAAAPSGAPSPTTRPPSPPH